MPGAVDDLPVELKGIAKNQDPQYCRDVELAFVNAKDVARPADLADQSASCYIKMTRPTFSSFVSAFKDPGSRVRLRHQMVAKHYSRIEKLTISGGYLDGVAIEFSDHLNVAIGGRGTGKSTLLECLRYALDLDHKGAEAKRQGEKIIKEDLGRSGGRVELEVVSEANRGQRYRVVRRYGEPPRVHDSEGNVSNLHPGRDLLPSIEVYGQNEIYELARDESARIQVLERFLPPEARQKTQFAELKKRLTENPIRLQSALSNREDLEQEIARLPKLNEQVAQFKALGIEEKLKQLPLLEKERLLQPRMDEEVQRVEDATQGLEESLPDLVFLSDEALGGLPHVPLLRRGREFLEVLKVATSKALTGLREAVKMARADLTTLDRDLKTALESAERALEAEFAKLPDVAGKRGREIGRAYEVLLGEIELIQPKEARLSTVQRLTDALKQERRDLLAELSDLRSQRAHALQSVAKGLNKRLRGKLRVEVIADGNRRALKTWLCALPNSMTVEKMLAGQRSAVSGQSDDRGGIAGLRLRRCTWHGCQNKDRPFADTAQRRASGRT